MGFSGRLDQWCQFQRRGKMPTTPGVARPGFSDYGEGVWGTLRTGQPTSVEILGLAITVNSGNLMVWDSPEMGHIRPGFRVVIDEDKTYEVRARQPLEEARGTAMFYIVEVAGREQWAAAMDARGEAITIRRVGTPNIERVVRGRVRDFTPEELVSGIDVGDSAVLLLAEDVEESGFPIPFETGGRDKVKVRGKVWNIEAVDDSTLRLAAELLAYDLTVSGA